MTAPLVVLALGAAALFALVIAPTGAGASTSAPRGYLLHVFQHRNRSITVSGFGYDRNHPRSHPRFCVVVGQTCVRYVYPQRPSPNYDRSHHISGGHRFVVTIRPSRVGARVALRGYSGGRRIGIDSAWASTPGKRIIAIARRYVGGNYTYGGSSPRSGFDCSGYTMYSYAHGRTASLPHNADRQRYAPYMRRIARDQARPGDLIFYMSGSHAVHVAIYAGHGYQYSATDEQQGIRYQRIYSRDVRFKTDWHR